MDLPPVRTHINLGTIRLATSVSGVDFHPYLWSVFFKVDGDTVFVDSSFTAQGQKSILERECAPCYAIANIPSDDIDLVRSNAYNKISVGRVVSAV